MVISQKDEKKLIIDPKEVPSKILQNSFQDS